MTHDNRCPVFLMEYDFIAELQKWARDDWPGARQRCWEILSYRVSHDAPLKHEARYIKVRLSWYMGNQVAHQEVIKPTAEEATYAALLYFQQWQKKYSYQDPSEVTK